MPNTVYALMIILLAGIASARADEPTVKEFQTSEGLVRLTSVPASTGEDGGTAAPDSALAAAGAFSLDTLTEIAALPFLDERSDPLVEVYFKNHVTGVELRFPAKISQFRDFLALHAAQYAGGTPESRSVATVRDLSRELSVQMRTPGSGGSK